MICSRQFNFQRVAITGCRIVALLVGMIGVAEGRAVAWPVISFPQQVAVFQIADEIEVNGMLMRLTGFTSNLSQSEIVAGFKHQLSAQVVETTVRGIPVLGWADREFYVTVQVEPTNAGARGVLAITRRMQSLQQIDDAKRAIDKLIVSLPPGTKIINRTVSAKYGSRAETVVAMNDASLSYNSERISEMLRGYGLMLEQSNPPKMANTLLYRGQNKEGAVVIRSTPSGSSIIFMTITDVGRGRQ